MATKEQRLAVARSAVSYLTERSDDEMSQAVPNCPGWTVRNAAVHVARACYSWGLMIDHAPDEEGVREQSFQQGMDLPEGQGPDVLAGWANEALDKMAGPDRECFFSMTGGPGDTGLWAWHSAAEIAVHRLDVEAALGHKPSITESEAIDATGYVAQYVTGALRSRSGEDPGAIHIDALGDDGTTVATFDVASDSSSVVSIRGPVLQILLGLWGRPTEGIEVVDGDHAVWAAWHRLPSQNIQFGAWD